MVQTEHGARGSTASEETNKNNFTRRLTLLSVNGARPMTANSQMLQASSSNLLMRIPVKLREIGFSNHPKVLKLFAKIADSFGEGKFVNPGSGTGEWATLLKKRIKRSLRYMPSILTILTSTRTMPDTEAARNEMAKWQEAKLAGKK
jgi:hypothetical protein